jgi:hypothetical protein
VSAANIELTRRWIDAFNARDIEAQIKYCDASIEFHSTFTAVGGGVYHGHDGMRRWHRDLQQAWGDEIRIDPEAFFDLGEHTLLFCELQGRGQGSGAKVVNPNANVIRWRDGLCVYLNAHAHREDALRELCVTQGELEPIAP